jgi:hypothetical protein
MLSFTLWKPQCSRKGFEFHIVELLSLGYQREPCTVLKYKGEVRLLMMEATLFHYVKLICTIGYLVLLYF